MGQMKIDVDIANWPLFKGLVDILSNMMFEDPGVHFDEGIREKYEQRIVELVNKTKEEE